MTGKESKRQIARIKALRKKWYSPLRLFEWDITWKYVDGDLLVDGALAEDAAAVATVDWRYRHATIQWNLRLIADQPADELERIFVHEVMHVQVNEMREGDLHHEERVCQTLALCFTDMARRLGD